MKKLHFFYQSMHKTLYNDAERKIADTKKKIQKELEKKASGPYDFIKIRDDNDFQKTVDEYSLIVVVGIGGSNLGAMALEQSLRGIYGNFLVSPRILFADTVDTAFIAQQKEIVHYALNKGEKVALVGITKSGKTTETIALFEVFVDLFLRHDKRLSDSIMVITEKNSPLAHVAHNYGFTFFEVPSSIGGRFSVFTAVGVIVCILLGLPWRELLAGARSAVKLSLDSEQEDIAAAHAAFIVEQYQQGIHIHDLFLFSNQLEMLGKWYRQLMGESLGKSETIDGVRKPIGITPTVSIGSTDLHSVGQLYLAGPRDRMTTFVIVEKMEPTLYVPQMPDFEDCVPYIQGISLERIMSAIIQGTQEAYKDQGLAYCTISLPEISPFFIGQYLQYAMLEIIYVADLLALDPFNQPQVELYKSHTRKILAHE